MTIREFQKSDAARRSLNFVGHLARAAFPRFPISGNQVRDFAGM